MAERHVESGHLRDSGLERKEAHMVFNKWRCELRAARKLLLLGFAALAAVFLCHRVGVSADKPALSTKIAMRILYAGHPGSAREKEFVEFLGNYFTQVQTGDLAKFTNESADGFDVMIFDYDEQGFNAPQPRLSQNYARPTVTVGVPGTAIGSQLGLKTGYL
jgi:hypothetical protein